MIRVAFIAVLLLIAVAFLACSSSSVIDTPQCDWRIYNGAPVSQSIVRTQDNEVIRCDAPEFAGFVCLSATDFKNLLTCSGK